MQIHGPTQVIHDIPVRKHGTTAAGLFFPADITLVIQTPDDADRLIVAAVAAKKLLTGEPGLPQSAPLDSESWTCAGCGGTFIGHRPAGDRCPACQPAVDADGYLTPLPDDPPCSTGTDRFCGARDDFTSEGPFGCTAVPHDGGNHVAYNPEGRVCHRWPATEPQATPPPNEHPYCYEIGPRDHICTAREGHAGDHAAWGPENPDGSRDLCHRWPATVPADTGSITS